MSKINFFQVDPETFEDIPIGSVTIEGGKIASDNEDLLDIARSSGDSPEEIIRVLSDWSNGYLRSELAEEPLPASGTIKLAETQSVESVEPPLPSGTIRLSEPSTEESLDQKAETDD